MITFKLCIRKDHQKEDKSWLVYIRVTYLRKVRYIPTSMFVTKKDLTASFKIKNQAILDRGNELIMVYTRKCRELNIELSELPIDTICEYLTRKNSGEAISFTSFYDKWLKTKKLKGAINYNTAMNAFKMFMGRENILFTDITCNSMREFERSLEDRPRAQSMYTSAIKRIFEEARFLLNDEDNGIIIIKHSLDKYTPPKQNVAKKRAISLEQIRAIFALPYDNIKIKGLSSRHDLALDCFRLSFCLMGMNSADLFSATDFDGEYITYNRMKTKDRRNDQAEMKILVDRRIMPIVEKYKGRERVFNFYERFGDERTLNRAINIGLKEVGVELGIENLQYYSARHSMATIAVNNVGINKYIVNDMLCHVDSSMRITDLYIEKDFAPINEANTKLLDFVLGKR